MALCRSVSRKPSLRSPARSRLLGVGLQIFQFAAWPFRMDGDNLFLFLPMRAQTLGFFLEVGNFFFESS